MSPRPLGSRNPSLARRRPPGFSGGIALSGLCPPPPEAAGYLHALEAQTRKEQLSHGHPGARSLTPGSR